MQTNIKKEVSCKALELLIHAANKKQLDVKVLLAGIHYDIKYLRNKHERVEWFVWCKMISNLRPYFSPTEFEEMGRSFVSRGSYWEGILWSFFLFTSNRFSRLLYNQIFKIGATMFACIKHNTDFLAPNKFVATAYLDEGYELSPEWSLICKGVWEELGKKIGQKGFRVEMSLIQGKTVFEVSWKQESIIFKLKKGFLWIFNIRKALTEITDSHDELLNQYQKLEASQKVLQEQTTQLKTAHKISTSIRQSLNIKDTLKAITDALVIEAGFSAAFIELIKDFDENNINVKFQSGKISEHIVPLHKEIIINEKLIGDLIIYPALAMDYREGNELLEYLAPVINVAIHDALVLSTVVDYRDNLEKKVSQRTFELQKARDELTEKNALLKVAHQTQNRFFTNISHEFRTPLTLILGPSKEISDQSKDEKVKSNANLIHRSASKLNRLVDELLDISKIESGEMKLKACPLEVISVIKDIVMSFYSLAERKSISFKINTDEEKIVAYLDKDKFEKIFNNILSNAFKFTPEGGRIDVVITSHPEIVSGTPIDIKKLKPVQLDNCVEISIQDTGIGIPEDQLDKIFDRFYQVDGSHTREHEGTGIGLALTKELVELHKGKIEVASEEGRGSTFKIIFPLGKDHLKPEEIFEEETETKREKINSELQNYLEERKQNIPLSEHFEVESQPSLLIVEDNADVRKYITVILESHYRIFEAKDGEDGLTKSFECIPDLIISDIMMPKIDGFQLCRKLKTDARTSHIPVIILTAKATMQDKIIGLEIGADDYIMKPFEAEELKARIKNLIEQRKRLHEHYRRYGLVEIEDKNITSIDRKFLMDAVAIINKHMAEAEFGVEEFADEMAVSRSLLFKKINSLLGESPSELIKRTRLNKAAKLIENNSDNISQIALEVGFNNPSYFAECFKKQFGVLPSHYHFKSVNS